MQYQFDGETTAIPHFILREVSALIDLNGHANILQLVDVFKIKGSCKIVLSFRFEKGGDLAHILVKNKILVREFLN